MRGKGGCNRAAALLIAFAQNQPVQRYAGLIGYLDALLKWQNVAPFPIAADRAWRNIQLLG
nr:MAG TPA: hypothetical protein [Caudoviricetes sp.]